MKIFLTIFHVLYFISIVSAQSNNIEPAIITGTVIEEDTGDPVIYGSVALYRDNILLAGVETDFDGKYVFTDIEAGIYDLEVSYVGFPTKRITDIDVINGQIRTVNIKMDNQQYACILRVVIGYEVPLYEPDNLTSGQTLISGDIKRRPFTRN